MSKKQCSMTIGVLAKAAGMGVETIRYYQRRGLVAEPEKPYGSIRHYDEQALARLHFIRTAQWLGFSLDEIGGLLKLEDGAHCDEARALAERKLDDLRRKIAALRQMESTLDSLVERCRCSEDPQRCPIIHSLQGQRDIPDEGIER
ncbi:Hg(II)-responsive transcriptional regulator [Marinobacter psychrophilus]|jgi:MerR family mercuric resistance operon transcriptional regulator|uniref:Hg(II)-responsive transcriptional regulator n=1 Tax=Marinobacter psychrophilus TaxID=330734 RepID=UPI001B513625|nr:Hg(II)-responsive transcriptional regulator [Marinobacter psychrophilus]MBQ0762187.1 Hg(II)-responsive transcriptional regulator [Marinobacter psychrophilus]MBQ0843761.1 Hg(II)-responsive transcriptional regulator [Marinobacter psychrophilus]